MEYIYVALVILVVIVIGSWSVVVLEQRKLLGRIEQKREELIKNVEHWFMIEPCSRCHEFKMKLLDISPNGRSVHYQCLHCNKKIHAPAGTPDAPKAISARNLLYGMVGEYNGTIWKSGRIVVDVVFNAPPAPLPFEQTTRTPIPEAVRSEVWRRDGGKCVQCGSKENLQFDHIIPVALGGATSVANLQLLCEPCNRSKGKKI
jgi:hypothetical protein